VFTRQIEAKQRELQPWSAKIRQKEGEINIANNEKDSLQRKLEAAQNAGAEAKAALDALKMEHQAKVRFFAVIFVYSLIYGLQEGEMQNVQRGKAGLGGELSGKQRDFQVGVISALLH
jgi:hypothetical protein